MRRRLCVTAAALLGVLAVGAAGAAEGPGAPPDQGWSFDGIFGTFDKAELQRGFQVYREVCGVCHSLDLVAYRNLAALGFEEEEIKAIAAEREVTDGPNEDGEMFQRPAQPSDHFVAPFPNENAAKAANNGALPPDLSLMVKARKGGANYLYAILTSYEEEPPEGVEIAENANYNAYFPGYGIAMSPPLSEGQVSYADGTEASVEQMARDVTAFLAWAAEPELEARKNIGIKVLLFLILFTGMLYAVKKKVWAELH